MRTKDETARLLADEHFRLDEAVTHIFRVVEPDEINPLRPVKLLEVNSMTPEVGISPVGLGADPVRGVFYASVVIEVSPGEFDRLRLGELSLPAGWRLGDELFPAVHAESKAS